MAEDITTLEAIFLQAYRSMKARYPDSEITIGLSPDFNTGNITLIAKYHHVASVRGHLSTTISEDDLTGSATELVKRIIAGGSFSVT